MRISKLNLLGRIFSSQALEKKHNFFCQLSVKYITNKDNRRLLNSVLSNGRQKL